MIRFHAQRQFISLNKCGFRIQLHQNGFISDSDIGFIDFADERHLSDDSRYPVRMFVARFFGVDELRSQTKNLLGILF